MLTILRHLTKHKYVVQSFVVRDLKIKYRGTVFGYLWSLLEPMSMVLIYDFVFRVIMRRGAPEYPLLIVLGILPYNYVSSVVQNGAMALVSNASLIRRVPLPREIFVLSLVGSNLVVFLLSMLSALPFMWFFGVSIGPRILLFPIAVVLLTALATGAALLVACANVVYRDVSYVLRVVTRLLMYLSPVVYQLTDVPERLRTLYLLNPLSVFLTMARNWMLDRPLAIPASSIGVATAMAVASFILGAYAFQSLEKKAVKFL